MRAMLIAAGLVVAAPVFAADPDAARASNAGHANFFVGPPQPPAAVGTPGAALTPTQPDLDAASNFFGGAAKREAPAASPAFRPAEATHDVLEFNAQSLADNFEMNEVRAKEETKGVHVVVRGRVKSVKTGLFGAMQINLRLENELMPMVLNMKEDQKEGVLKTMPGDRVRIECRYFHKVLLLNGEHCALLPAQKQGAQWPTPRGRTCSCRHHHEMRPACNSRRGESCAANAPLSERRPNQDTGECRPPVRARTGPGWMLRPRHAMAELFVP